MEMMDIHNHHHHHHCNHRGMGGSPGDVNEEPANQEKRNKGWRMNCDVGEVTERQENEQSSVSKLSVTSLTSQLILQPFRRFTYITARSPTLLSLLLRHGLFTYVTWRAAHASMIAIMMMIMNVHHFNKCINLNLRGFRSV